MRLPLALRDKRFRLFVACGDETAPPDRWFGSRRAALRAFDGLRDEWKPSAWVIEYREHHGATVGGIPIVRNVVHIRHGERQADPSGDEPTLNHP